MSSAPARLIASTSFRSTESRYCRVAASKAPPISRLLFVPLAVVEEGTTHRDCCVGQDYSGGYEEGPQASRWAGYQAHHRIAAVSRPSETKATRVNVPTRTGSGVVREDSLDASIGAIQIDSPLTAQPDAIAVPLIVLEVAVEHEVA